MGSICSRNKTDAFRALFGSESVLGFRQRSKKTVETYLAVFVIIFLILSFTLRTRATMNRRYICDKIPGLTPRQRNVCYTNPSAIVVADEGSFMGLEECRRQFEHSRWNCRSESESSAMGGDESIGTKEAAFHGAIRAAGVLHAVAKACTEGELRNCGCDASKRNDFKPKDYIKWGVKRMNNGNVEEMPSSWTWGGCSVDIRRANRFCREIWDTRETTRSVRAKMNIHNYEAGRKILMKKLKVRCKCHGASASCAIHTCWIALPDFREIGSLLRNSYQRSKKVKSSSDFRGRNRCPMLTYMRNGLCTKPQKRDLIYTEESPSYCVYNSTTRSEGTKGRVCRQMSSDKDNCSYLCCGRGHEVQHTIRTWDCKCKFYWCCHVECDQCHEPAKQYTCL